ncbi:MAG: hypothetical protein L0Z55_03850 [Planctomycetes bacterium]|nr:hypothetical protein [Planctomycetota bacterium]
MEDSSVRKRSNPSAAAAATSAPAPELPALASEAGIVEQSKVFARLYEEDERVDGRARWSIGDARRQCWACAALLAERAEFHTALFLAGTLEPADQVGVAAELFERRDYCARCFPAVPLESRFAHWRGTIPASETPPKKIVNLTALLAYFERLAPATAVEAGAASAPPGASEQAPIRLASGLAISRALLRFLLALFLVRKKALRWRDLAGGVLELATREEPPRVFRAAVPAVGEQELEAAMAAFDELFA